MDSTHYRIINRLESDELKIYLGSDWIEKETGETFTVAELGGSTFTLRSKTTGKFKTVLVNGFGLKYEEK